MSGGAKSLLDGAEILKLDPNDIEIDLTGRIGFFHEDKAAAFGRLLATDGQRDTVKVSRAKKGAERPWRLHVGLHRTMGARAEGLPIYAVEVKGTADQLRDLEASENLHRRPLQPIERAKFVHALCEAAQERIARQYGDLKQQQLGAKARWAQAKAGERRVEDVLQEESDDAADKMSAAYGWQESAADALDLDKRTIRRSLELYRLLVEPFPELAEPLSKHPVVGENASQLKAIAQVRDEAQRRQVIELLLLDPELSADEARVQAGLPDPKGGKEVSPEMVLVNRAIGTLARMKDGEREAFVEDQVLKQRVPVMRRIYQRLKEELGE